MLRHHCPPGGEDAAGRRGGTPMETPGSSSYRRPLALVLLGLGSSSVLWHGVPVSQCPFSDFPACLLQCALKAKLAVEAILLSPKRQLEETSSKRLQAVALVHGLLVACRGTQVTSELCSGSQPLSLPLGCCLWQENRCPLGAGRFHRCAEPVPLWAQHGLLKRSRACTDAALERICSRAQTAELISWQR